MTRTGENCFAKAILPREAGADEEVGYAAAADL
jgi:hypothetical protein